MSHKQSIIVLCCKYFISVHKVDDHIANKYFLLHEVSTNWVSLLLLFHGMNNNN